MQHRTIVILISLAMTISFLIGHSAFATENLSLKYNNEGINFYTTDTIYTEEWKDTLNNTLNTYEELLYKPDSIDVYLVETNAQAQAIRMQNNHKAELVLSLESIKNKQHQYNTAFATLSHEICHIWLIESAKNRGIVPTPDPMGLPSYGHSNLNDWIDESVATACESGDMEKSRVNNSFSIVPLEDFLAQENPAFSAMKQQILAALNNTSDQQIVISQETDDSALPAFYQQSTWFRMFLIERTGKDIYRSLIEQIANKHNPAEFLLKKLNHQHWQEVDSEFQQFINTNLNDRDQAKSAP